MILRPLFQWRPLGCGRRNGIPTDMKLIPAGRNTGIQPLHKGYRLWIKTTKIFLRKLRYNILPAIIILKNPATRNNKEVCL